MPRAIRVGLLAYSSNTGLGVQTLEFAEHLNPAKVLLVDLSDLNKMPVYPERFAAFDVIPSKGFPTMDTIDRFLDGLDVAFVCETPLNYDLFSRARERGVGTILQPNHEFNDYYADPNLPKPDLFALPSTWHYDDLPYDNKRLLRVPVAAEKLPTHTDRSNFRRFLHIAGRPAAHDRNGTREVIAAFRQVSHGGATLVVRTQVPEAAEKFCGWIKGDPRITIDSTDVPDYWDAYGGFDCLVLPRRYGGLCLPVQEALGSGIPVIMTNVSPNEDVLPKDWLVSAKRTDEFEARSTIGIYTADVTALTDCIEDFCNMSDRAAGYVYRKAQRLGEDLSWKTLASEYRALFEEVADA